MFFIFLLTINFNGMETGMHARDGDASPVLIS